MNTEVNGFLPSPIYSTFEHFHDHEMKSENNDVETKTEEIPLIPTHLSKEEVRRNSWLNQQRDPNFPITLDLQLFAHEAAAAYVNKSLYEGISVSKTTKSFINLLRFEKDLLLTNDFVLYLIQLLSQCSVYAEKIDEIISSTEHARKKTTNHHDVLLQQKEHEIIVADRKNKLLDFSLNVFNNVQNLQTDQQLLIPGGWRTEDGGHTILYLFQRTSDKDYNFTVFNTGAGIDHHPSIVNSKGEKKHQLFLEFKGIPLDTVLNKDFFEVLMGIELAYIWTNEDRKDSNGNDYIDLYSLFLPTLAEYLQEPNDQLNFFYIKPQRSGTCSMKSLLAVVRYLLITCSKDPNTRLNSYKHLRYIFQRHAIIKTCLAYFKTNVPYDRSAHRLITDAVRILSRSAIKLHNKKILNNEDVKSCLATIVDIRSRLKLKKELHQIQFAESEECKSSAKIIPSNPTIFTNKFDFTIGAKLPESNDYESYPLYEFPSLKSVSSEGIVEYLTQWSETKLKEYFNDKDKIISQIILQLRQLPIPSRNNLQNSIWSSIPNEKIEVCLAGLYTISKYLEDFYSQSKKYKNFSDNFVEIHSILCIADFLARSVKENKLDEFKLPVHFLVRYVEKSTHFIYNPVIQERLHKILNYFVPTIDFRVEVPSKYYLPNNEKTIFTICYDHYLKIKPLVISDETIETIAELKYYKQFIDDLKRSPQDPKLANTKEYIAYIARHSLLTTPIFPKSVIYLKYITMLSQTIDISDWSFSSNGRDCCGLDCEFTYSTQEVQYERDDDSESEKEVSDDEIEVDVSEQDKSSTKLYLYLLEQQDQHVNNQGTDDSMYPFDVQLQKHHTLESNRQGGFNVEKGHQNDLEPEDDTSIQGTNSHDDLIRVLVYLEKNPQNYFTDGEKKLIKMHFFRYNNLFSQILQYPRSILKIVNLLHKNIEYLMGLKNWDDTFFFIEIANHFVNYVKYAQKLYPKKNFTFPEAVIRDYKQWSIDTILPQIKDDDHTTVSLLCLFVAFNISKEGIMSFDNWITEFSIDWFILKRTAKSKKIINFDEILDKPDNGIHLLINMLMPYVNQKLTDDPNIRRIILNKIFSPFTNEKNDLEWTGEYPLYKSGHFEMDLKNFIIKGDDNQLGSLPNYIVDFFSKKENSNTKIERDDDSEEEELENEEIPLFNEINEIKKIGNNVYTVTDRNGDTSIRLTNDRIQIYRLIDQIGYQLLTLPMSNKSVKSFFYHFNHHNTFLDRVLPLFVKSESMVWISVKPVLHCLIQNKNGDSFYLYGSSENKYQEYFSFNISSISNRKDGSTVLVNQNSIKNHKKFEDFATANKLLLWADSKDLSQILEIEMPLLNQKFVRSKDIHSVERYFSQQNTGFYIADNQFDQFQNKWPPYLVLENENKKKIVLMLQIKTVDTQEKKNFDPLNKAECLPIVHCYNVEMVAGKVVLRPQSVSGALNLTIAWMQIARYKMALDLIPECLKNTSYSKTEIDLCKILQDNKKWGNHPSLVLLRLKFKSECHQSIASKVQDDLSTFYNQINNITVGKLTDAEETNLYIEKRVNYTPEVQQRIRFLNNPNNQYGDISSDVMVQKDINKNRYRKHISLLYSKYISETALEILHKMIKGPDSDDASDQDNEISIELPYRPIKIKNSSTHTRTYIDNILLTKILPFKSLKEEISLPMNLDQLDWEWDQRIITLKDFDLVRLCSHFDLLCEKLEKFEKNLLIQANSISSQANTIDGLFHQGQVKKKVFLKDILNLFELGNIEDYAEATYLSKEQIIRLDQHLAVYLIEKTRIAQIKRIIALKKELLKLLDPLDRQLKELEIKNEFFARRSYALSLESNEAPPPPKRQRLDKTGYKQVLGYSENRNTKYIRTFLLLEARNEIFLRDLQVDIINEIDNDAVSREKLVVAGTGSGKSTTIAPLAERTRGTENRLVFNVWPQSLFVVNQENMEKSVRDAFGQKSISFQFHRNSSISKDVLQKLYRKLVWARHEKYQINTTPESLQSFQLKYLEVLHEHCNGKAVQEKLKVFHNILKLIGESEFHIDEAHINLSPKKEVCFTIGTPKSEPSERYEFVDEIFQFLTSEKIESVLGLKQDLQRFINQDVLNGILNELVVHLSKSLNVTDDQLSSFLEYIRNGKTSPWMFNHPKQEFFVILYQHINVLFPTIFQRSVNVNFGLSKIDKKVLYAKPYRGNDSPIETADYENIYETLCKSYLVYLYQGLSPDNLWEVILFLQKGAVRESRENKIDLDKTNSSLLFNMFFGEKRGTLFAIQRKEIDLYYKEYKVSTKLILFFVKKFVASTIQAYNLKLKSSAQDLLSLSGNKNIALTATPGNTNIYCSNINIVSIGSSEIQVKEKLIKDDCPIHTVHSCLPRDILSHAIKLLKEDFRMMIDVGALFKGINNKHVAELILKHYQDDSAIQGVVFFDDSDQLQVLKKGSTRNTMSISQSGLTPDQLFTYCDQRHAFGTDTKQMPKAKALATFDLITTKDEIIQGTGRLRGFLQRQKIEWLLTGDTRKNMHLTGDLHIKHIISFAELTQQHQERENILRSFKHQMNQEVRTILFNILINIENPNLLSSFFSEVSSFFVEEVNTSLKLPAVEITSEQSVNPLISHLNLLKTKVNNSTMLLEDMKTFLKSRLDQYYDKIDNFVSEVTENGPDAQSSSFFKAVDLETEVQNQNEVQVQYERQTELEQSSQISQYYDDRIIRNWPKNFSIYNYNWMINLRQLPAIANEYVPLCKMSTLFNSHFENPISKAGDLLFPRDIFEIISESISPLPWSDLEEEFSKNDANYESEIFCTSNFLTDEPFMPSFTHLISPFAKEQKTVFEFLVIEDKLINENKSKWTIIVGDQSTDTMFWRENLSKINPKEAQGMSRRACLYDLNFGIVVDSPNTFAEEELSSNYEFQKLLTRIKLFNGDFEFNQMQRAILSDLVPTPEKKIILREFFERVIQWKKEKKKLYKDSWLKSFLM